MPLYLIETDAGGNPLDPVLGYFGPIVELLDVSWIANEVQCDGSTKIVPEIEWPTTRHPRRVDWGCVGVRPPRAMPRGLRFALQSAQPSFGEPPPGVIGTELEVWNDQPEDAPRDQVEYFSNDGQRPAATCSFVLSVLDHLTNEQPLQFDGSDFLFATDMRILDLAGRFWRLLHAPIGYDGGDVLPTTTVRSLAIARPILPPPTDKTRSIVFAPDSQRFCDETHLIPPATLSKFQLSWGPFQIVTDGTMVMEYSLSEFSQTPFGTYVWQWNVFNAFAYTSLVATSDPNPSLNWQLAVTDINRDPVLTGFELFGPVDVSLEVDCKRGDATGWRWLLNGAVIHENETGFPDVRCRNVWGRGSVAVIGEEGPGAVYF